MQNPPLSWRGAEAIGAHAQVSGEASAAADGPEVQFVSAISMHVLPVCMHVLPVCMHVLPGLPLCAS